jgi:ParB/RepB/Spo0J family partition protein
MENIMTDETAIASTTNAAANKGKTGAKALAVGRSDLYRLRPTDINVKEGFNSRVRDFDPDDADDIALAHSIAQVGVKQPVTVFNEDGRVYLSDGHRRLAAALYAIEHIEGTPADLLIPTQTEPAVASEADRIFSQIVRNSGKPFSPLEQALVYKKLIGHGWTVEDIALKAGFSTQRIRDLLALDALPKKVKKMVSDGKVSATLAITTLKQAKGEAGKVAALLTSAVDKAKKEGKTKATQKDVAVAAPNPKARLRAIFSELTFTQDGEGYTVGMSADEYAELRTLIGW